MWRNARVAVLLFILLGVVVQQWFDRESSTAWDRPLWVGVYPLNGDGSAAADKYIRQLQPEAFESIEAFFANEAQRFKLKTDTPVHIELYPQGKRLPPVLAPDAGPLGTALWSLKLRWFASHAADVPGRAAPHIRVFVLYHDPDINPAVPHSLGLQKGLIGVVHAFATRSADGTNSIVIAHEVMHTLGATDKYDPLSNAPLYPIGFAEPERQPLYPQADAEIMAGQRALSPSEHEMPHSLSNVVVGPLTAAEIRWIASK